MEQIIEVGNPSREEIHDTLIRPLMAEVIKIAEEHNIPLLVVMLLMKIALHGIEQKAEGSVH